MKRVYILRLFVNIVFGMLLLLFFFDIKFNAKWIIDLIHPISWHCPCGILPVVLKDGKIIVGRCQRTFSLSQHVFLAMENGWDFSIQSTANAVQTNQYPVLSNRLRKRERKLWIFLSNFEMFIEEKKYYDETKCRSTYHFDNLS